VAIHNSRLSSGLIEQNRRLRLANEELRSSTVCSPNS